MPAPDGPTSATRAPLRHAERDAAEHVDVALRVGGVGQVDRRAVHAGAREDGDRFGFGLAAGADDGFGVGKWTSRNSMAAAIGASSGRRSTRMRAAIVASFWVSVGRSMTSWMRPSAPSAWLTEVIAPKVEPSGAISRKRNMMNVTRLAIVIAPEATRKSADAEHDEQRHLQGDAGDGDDERRDLGDAHADAVDARSRCPVTAATSRSVAPDGAHGADGADGALDARGEFADLLLLLGGAVRMRPLRSDHDGDRDADHERRSRPSSTGSMTAIAIDGADEDEHRCRRHPPGPG